ncbi:YHS domain-containing protein [Gammaproteobacteria bacterium AH-315-C21]|nr:YHS domain-containing protein [Gammaproteobacteria bacterium AH-315-C21]
MTRLNDTCPVCGMKVDIAVPSVEHYKMFFHFCSGQCRETFVAHPNLYSAKLGQERDEIFKQRTMRLTDPLDKEMTELLIAYLMVMMGVKKVAVEAEKVHITYDLLQVTELQIETALVEIGVQLGGDWMEQLRRAWVHDSEEIELDNLAAPPAPCPNRPPPGA